MASLLEKALEKVVTLPSEEQDGIAKDERGETLPLPGIP
jgi:hypothetical protein